MGRSLHITVIAEGVESEAQGRFRSELGCDQLQGSWIAAPLPMAAFAAWVEQRVATVC